MTIRPRTPSLFRPRKPIDQSVLTENRKLIADIDRRGLLRGAVSLGALTMLTGCDVSEVDSVQKPPRFNAYYPIEDVKPVDGASWTLELAGRIADKRPWLASALYALPEQE